MKIGIVADLHLNKSNYKQVMDRDEFTTLPFRTADFMRSFRWITQKIITDIHPDLVVINGDIYDYYEPNNEVRGFFSRQLSLLAEQKIPVLILLGNHDVCKRHHALNDIEQLHLKNIKVITQPKIFDFEKQDKSSKIRLLLFPYSLDMEREVKTIKEEFHSFLAEIQKKDKVTYPSLFFGHFPVFNAIMNTYTIEDSNEIINIQENTVNYVNKNSKDINLQELDSIGAPYVFLGDLHRFQLLDTKKCIAMYSGSIEKNNFTEINQSKGFVVYDDSITSNKKMGSCTFIEYPFCRPMLELKGNLDSIKQQLNKIDISKYNNAIVKISFIGTSMEFAEYSVNIDALKKNILELLKAIHVDCSQPTIEDPEVKDAISKIEAEIQKKGDMDASDVIEIVKEIITEKVSDEKERSAIIEEAMNTYKETMQERK